MLLPLDLTLLKHVTHMWETLSVFKDPSDVELTHLYLSEGQFVTLLSLELFLNLILACYGRLTHEAHSCLAHV